MRRGLRHLQDIAAVAVVDGGAGGHGGWGVAVIMSSRAMVTTEAGLLGWLPATMGYVGRSSGPCDCLLRISNV